MRISRGFCGLAALASVSTAGIGLWTTVVRGSGPAQTYDITVVEVTVEYKEGESAKVSSEEFCEITTSWNPAFHAQAATVFFWDGSGPNYFGFPKHVRSENGGNIQRLLTRGGIRPTPRGGPSDPPENPNPPGTPGGDPLPGD